MMADIFGIPVLRPQLLSEATSFGAALAGGIGVGLYKGFELAREMTPVVETVIPDPALGAVYRRLYEIFTQAYETLVPLYDQLNTIPDDV